MSCLCQLLGCMEQEAALKEHLSKTLLSPDAFFKRPPPPHLNGAAHSMPPKSQATQPPKGDGQANGDAGEVKVLIGLPVMSLLHVFVQDSTSSSTASNCLLHLPSNIICLHCCFWHGRFSCCKTVFLVRLPSTTAFHTCDCAR